MSDTNETQTESTEKTETKPAPTAKAKRNGVKHETVVKLAEDLGLQIHNDGAAYTSAGHKGGVRLNFSKAEEVTRAYLYMATPPADAGALVKLTPEQRKEKRYGKIECEVDFTKDEAEVLTALKLCLGAVAESAPPAPKPVKAPKVEKTEAAKPTPAPVEETTEQPAA